MAYDCSCCSLKDNKTHGKCPGYYADVVNDNTSGKHHRELESQWNKMLQN